MSGLGKSRRESGHGEHDANDPTRTSTTCPESKLNLARQVGSPNRNDTSYARAVDDTFEHASESRLLLAFENIEGRTVGMFAAALVRTDRSGDQSARLSS